MPIESHKPQGRFALGCLGLLTPRIVIILHVIFSDYIGTAFSWWLWPFLGFLFMPITTLAAAVAYHEVETRSSLPIAYWGVIALGIILDLGLIGGGQWGLKRNRR